MTIQYQQMMLPWTGVVMLIAGYLLLSRRSGRSQL